MLFYIISVIAAFFAGAYFHPAIKNDSTGWYFYYSLGKGVRNKIKLF